ncbi:MAG: sugar phosphate isomerase/epimerase [Bacteroides sp.]|jgi:sugar phosphate isomerase/epimerase|nr:sugar phosphate isomerase/epimerase [Bacteroides sp.]
MNSSLYDSVHSPNNQPLATRREFFQSLKLLSLGVVLPGCAIRSSGDGVSKEKKELGAQLWSVRDLIGTNLSGTLEALSRMGFSGIEPYDYDGSFYGIPAKEFNRMCDELDLEIYATHTGITIDNAREYAETAAAIGMRFLVLPSFKGRPADTIDDFKATAEEMNRIGEVCNEFGVRFAYHNHEFELRKIEDVLPYDVLLSETEAGLVSFQADTYFFAREKLDPIPFFDKYAGRFSMLHLKDVDFTGNSCIIGNGIIDFKTVLSSARKAGVELLIYEQEECSEGTSLHCAEQSLRYIHSHLLKNQNHGRK